MWTMQKKEEKEKKKRNKRCIPKEDMPHAWKACQKKEKKERCIPKEDMPHARKACQKKEKNIDKDSPHPWKTKKREGSCKGVHPPLTKKIPTHLHILIKLHDSFLLGSCFWLNNISKANKHLYSYPKLHISLIRW